MSLLSTLLGTSAPDATPSLSEKAESKRVQRLITESNGYLTLGPAEVKVLKRLLNERHGDDPFTRSPFTVKDAGLLGLEIDPNDDTGSNPNTTHELSNQSQMEYDVGMLPAHLALVAPDLTPGHSSPVSTSEAQRVIGPQEPKAPAAPVAATTPQQVPVQTAESRAAAMLGLDGSSVAPPLNEGAPPAASGDINQLAANLAESRRRRNQAKKPSHGNVSPHSEEGRKLASAAAAKLAAL